MSEQIKPLSCLYPKSPRDWLARGLCANHYRQVTIYIKAGKTTWSELEAAGKALPPKTGRYVKGFQAWALGKPTEVA